MSYTSPKQSLETLLGSPQILPPPDPELEYQSPKQHEWNLPDDVLRHCLFFLPAWDISRSSAVCRRWRRVLGDEEVWRKLSKRAFAQWLPPISVPTIDGEEKTNNVDDEVSLSIARQDELDAIAAIKLQSRIEHQRRVDARAEALAIFKSNVTLLRSYRRAYPFIPQLFESGLYVLREEYTRRGVRDMFHVAADVLKVVFHRCFWFREDGSLLYSMLPGQPFEAVKEMRKLVTRLSDNSNSGNVSGHLVNPLLLNVSGGAGGSVVPPPLPPQSNRAIGRISRARVLELNTSRGSGADVERNIGKGWWRLDGRQVFAEVTTAGKICTRWVLEIVSGNPKQLEIISLTLTEQGSPQGEGTLLSTYSNQVLDWKALPIHFDKLQH